MEIKVKKEDESYFVKIIGELVFSELDKFEKEVISRIDNEPGNVLIDVSEVVFVDSSGLGALVKIYSKVRVKGLEFVLIGPSEEFKKILKIANLLDLLKICEDEVEAREYLKNSLTK